MKSTYRVEVLENFEISKGVFRLVFECSEIAKDAVAGQFLQIYIDKGEHILPRPISICNTDRTNGTVTIVYQVVGKGTDIISKFEKGYAMKVLGPLGNGYGVLGKEEVIVVGGGIGIPPLVMLVKKLMENNVKVVHVFLGFRSNIFLVDEFEKPGAKVYISTDDGSLGFHGNVVELMRKEKISGDAIYSCGPKVMLKGVSDFAIEKNIFCQVSMEERMACGIGVCVGCAVKIKSETSSIYKKVCKDGPVFDAREVFWDE